MNTRKQIALTLSLLTALPVFASSAGFGPESGSSATAQGTPWVRQESRGESERQPPRPAERRMSKEQREIHELARTALEDGQLSQQEQQLLACRIAAIGGYCRGLGDRGLSRYLKLHNEYGHLGPVPVSPGR